MLIFDMDGTLIDSNGVWREVDIAFLKKRGFPYTKEYYQGVAHTIFPKAAVFIGVTQTFWLSDVIDPNIPTAMLPADVQQFMFGKNDSTMLIVRFDAPSASDETMEAVQQIEKLLRKDCFFGGMSVILQDTKALVNQEMPLYILIAVGASLLVLFL